MKILTLNFLTCARKACKPSAASFPLHPRDAVLETVDADLNAPFLRNILPRLEWTALLSVCGELGLPGLVARCPEAGELFVGAAAAGGGGGGQDGMDVVQEREQEQEQKPDQDGANAGGGAQGEPSQLARDLHRLLIETCISEGKLVCGNCGHEYAIKEGIANFLLPPHLV